MPTNDAQPDHPVRIRDAIDAMIEEYGSGNVTLALVDAYERLAERNRAGGFDKAADNFANLATSLRTAHARIYRYARR
jgi:hypothetical protein